MTLYLIRGENQQTVPLQLPATPADIEEAYSMLDEVSRYEGEIGIAFVVSEIPNIGPYVRHADLSNADDVEHLNQMNEKIETMNDREKAIFAGALDANSINGLDDVLRIADSLVDYLIIPNVTNDTELGRFIAISSQINGDPRFPEASWPYLDFARIGAEYYAEHGGAYTDNGYVLRREETPSIAEERPAEPWRNEDRAEVFVLELSGPKGPYTLVLPADEQYLDDVEEYMGVSGFAETSIMSLRSSLAYLAELLPMELVNVEDANELALALEEMQQEDGELLKFCSVLAVEQPETFPAALRLALALDNYERIIEGTYEYGQTVLRRLGADDEIIDAIDGYMDFAAFGENAMEENHVRSTEFGLVERLDIPFPSQSPGPQMGGM